MLDPVVITAIAVPAIIQAGASVYFAGSVNRAVEGHEKRLDAVERTAAGAAMAAAELKGKMETV